VRLARAAALFACTGFAPALIGFAAPAAAQASFGISAFEVQAVKEGGAPETEAGSHPYSLTTTIAFDLQSGGQFTEGDLRDLRIEEPPGLIENPAAVPKCAQAQFQTPRASPFEEPSLSGENCPADTQVGVVTVHTSYGGGATRRFGVFNLAPPPGVPSQLGFAPYGAPVTLDSGIRGSEGSYGLTLESHGFPQTFDLKELELTIWGVPWGVSHNGERGNCLNEAEPGFPWAKCSVGPPVAEPPLAYLAMPASCSGPLAFTATADSWQQPALVSATYETPQGLADCESLAFDPRPAGQLSDRRTTSPSGYAFELDNESETFTNPAFRVPSQVKKAVLTLPQGLTINPSVGAGLGYCTPASYAAETAFSPPGSACPNDSKIGDFTVQSPLFEETLGGTIFLAQPDAAATSAPGAENPFDTLLAVYLVARSPQRGILVKVAGKIEPNQLSGQLTASFDNLPQLPYTNLRVHFREGQRAPLVTPAACGAALTRTELTPWLGTLATVTSQFESIIEAGIGGGPCPAGTPPFTPQAKGGTLNPNAGSYTPFYLHLTRTDAEQEITSYSAQLPPGLLGKIAGVPFCPEAAIAAAKRETGVGEEQHPSCPAASSIGHTIAGYGVGSALTYAPGGLYLAGPFHGAPLSIVAIDSATVGPFDLGVIVVRSAIRVDPRTAQVSVDSAGSDPIPHILDGIPLHLRDVRVYISKPNFTINPTSCNPFTLTSTLTGSAAPFTDPKDITATASVPYQVSNCSSLSFKPKLALKLKGGTKRGDYPSLRAVLTPRPGDANIGAAAVTLPKSEFLAQNHIQTICTRPQLEAEACPAGSVYGHATAVTPLLEEPMTGNVYLRSSSNLLPDLVTVLHGRGVRILVEGRIDSSHGGLRGTFEGLPDAPVTKFTMVLNGGRRGLLVNEKNLCAASQLATVRLVGQSNQAEALKPQLQSNCHKHRRHRRHRR
jgi:hypothetical protein